MKRTWFILLLVVAFTSSCKKEKIQVFTDIELNQQIDKKFADNILTMSSSQRDALAFEKEIVLRRIIKNNPKIRFSDLYPKKDKEVITYLAKEVCVVNYVHAMDMCSASFYVTAFTSVITAVAMGIKTAPATGGVGGVVVGVVTGAALLGGSAYAYWSCSVNAADSYKYCQSH